MSLHGPLKTRQACAEQSHHSKIWCASSGRHTTATQWPLLSWIFGHNGIIFLILYAAFVFTLIMIFANNCISVTTPYRRFFLAGNELGHMTMTSSDRKWPVFVNMATHWQTGASFSPKIEIYVTQYAALVKVDIFQHLTCKGLPYLPYPAWCEAYWWSTWQRMSVVDKQSTIARFHHVNEIDQEICHPRI